VRYTNRNYQSDFDEKVKTLYNTYSSTTYDERALVEVLHNGIPHVSKTLIQNTVREKQFSREEPLEFHDFVSIVQAIHRIEE